MDPDRDGIDHINVYSKGKTELGRLLSNFAHTPFKCEDGHFESVEGYWYWLLSDVAEREVLRKLYGWNAKDIGKYLVDDDYHIKKDEEFRRKIKLAIWIKLNTHLELKTMVIDSTLPFEHYYVYKDNIVEGSAQWIIDFLERARNELKKKENNQQ